MSFLNTRMGVLVTGLCLLCQAQGAPPWTYSGSGPWMPPTLGDQHGNLVPYRAFPMDAVVSESPLQITLRIFSGPNQTSGYNTNIAETYDIFRKDPAATSWGPSIGSVTVAENQVATFVDTNVEVGKMYEYSAAASRDTKKQYGYVVAGIKVDQTQSRGRMALVVANDIPANLPLEYARYKADLVADGWIVHEISTPRANSYASNNTGASVLSTVVVTSQGSDYTTGQTVILSNGSSKAVGTLTANSSKLLTGVTVTQSAPGFVPGQTLTFSGNTTGTGAVLTAGSVVTNPAEHINIRNQIKALYDAYPGELKNVVILGRVAVPRSGISTVYPDGHGNKAAVGADAFYADMDGVWTDIKTNAYHVGNGIPVTGFVNHPTSVAFPPEVKVQYNDSVQSSLQVYRGLGEAFPDSIYTFSFDTSFNGSSGSQGGYSLTIQGGNVTAMTGLPDPIATTSSGKINLPGDNKYDAELLTELTPNDALEIGFGRVDLTASVPGDYEGMRTYFNKLHRYKMGAPDFQPGRRAIYRSGFGMITRAFLATMPGALGMSQLDFISGSDLPAVPPDFDPDSGYTKEIAPYLFYFKGSGGPEYSDGGRAVFWTGMQSHWGYWYESNISSGSNVMQRRLAEDNYTLSYTWSIGLNLNYEASYLYHRMGMGFDAGDMMRVSMSYRGNQNPVYTPTGSPLFMNHMGCPSLRLFMFPPPTALSVVKMGGNPSLSWTAPTAPPAGEPQVLGYHVYRSESAAGPFTRLTTSPLTATTYEDETVSSGIWHYQVKAVRLETTGGGSYYNASLGVQQSIDLTNGPSALAIATTSLPGAAWNTPYEVSLSATGGTPVYTWSIDSGFLPPGLALSPSGRIHGLPTTAGAFSFTVEARDASGQTEQKAFNLTVGSNGQSTFFAEANTYITGTGSYVWRFYDPTLSISRSNNTYLRFDISSLEVNNDFVRAKLILTLDGSSQANSYILVNAALSQDAGDAWIETGTGAITYATRPLDLAAAPPVYASSFPVAYGTIELDVTDFVRRTLANDPNKKLGLRLFSNQVVSFGDDVKISTRYATGNARPRLVIETTDAPAIAFQTPTVNPASIHVGSSLVINATATPIPAQAGALSVQWSKQSGPGSVTFSSANTASTTAAFSAAGDYVLRLRAEDSVLSSYRDLTVRVLAVPAATAPVTGPTDGLILRLPFDEGSGTTAADVSGSSPANNGTLASLNAVLPSWISEGIAGGALNFTGVAAGTGQRVEVNDSATTPLDGMQKMTASLWIKLNADSAAGQALLAKRSTSSSSTYSYAISLSSAERLSVSVANTTSLVGDNTLAVGVWHHVAMVYDGSLATNDLQVYLNGSPEKFGTKLPNTTLPRFTTSKLTVGDFPATASSAPFNGQIDEVRLYNRALSIDEIQDLAKAKPANMGPKIVLNAAEVSGTAGQPVEVGAVVTDDGLPGALTLQWQKASGPGSVVFSDPVSGTTDATPSTAGSYGLRLLASDGSITTFADVAATFEPGSGGAGIASWRQLYFGTTENTGNAADDANPMGDGLRNLLKYALGLNPNVDYRGSGLMPKGQLEEVGGQEYLTYTFTRNTAVSDVTLSVEVVNDLTSVTWGQIDPLISVNQVEVLENTPSAGIQTITVKDTQPVGSSTKRFMRLKVTRP
jgi:hypothetical protein